MMNNEKLLISIIIVNWNGEKWLKKCFDSLCAQTYRNFEIIFVDNASIDDSVEFVKKNYPEVIIVESDKNLGFAGGNNLGFKYVKGTYVLFLNNDTWVEADFLEKLVLFYEEHDYAVVGPTEADYYTGVKRRPYNSFIDPFGWHVYSSDKKYLTLPSFYLTGVCFFVTTDLYLKSGCLDNDFFMYCEEVDWFWRLHLMNKTSSYVRDIFVYHAGSGSSTKGLGYTTFLWRNQNTLQMLLKNYAWYSLIWVLPVYFLQNIFEILVFLIFLKPKIAWSYVEGWWFNIVNFRKIMQKRKWIQENRMVVDMEIMKKMYFGFGKAYHLLGFVRNKFLLKL